MKAAQRVFTTPGEWLEDPVRIHLVGAGGTGSQLADQLGSLHVTLVALGHPGLAVTIHDGDTVERHNAGRQRFTPADVGQNKAVLLCHRINQFYGTDWKAVPEYHDPRQGFWHACDIIITAVDKARYRVNLAKARHYGRRVWIDCGNGARNGQVEIGHLGGDKSAPDYLPNILDLYPELEAQADVLDTESPSCSAEDSIRKQEWPVNRMAAQLLADLLWQAIRDGELRHHGYTFTVSPVSVSPMPVCPETWAMYGFKPRKTKRKTGAKA